MELKRAAPVALQQFETVFLTEETAKALPAAETARILQKAMAYAEEYQKGPEAFEHLEGLLDMENAVILTREWEDRGAKELILSMEAFWETCSPLTKWDYTPLGSTVSALLDWCDEAAGNADQLAQLQKKLEILEAHVQYLLKEIEDREEKVTGCLFVFRRYQDTIARRKKEIEKALADPAAAQRALQERKEAEQEYQKQQQAKQAEAAREEKTRRNKQRWAAHRERIGSLAGLLVCIGVLAAGIFRPALLPTGMNQGILIFGAAAVAGLLAGGVLYALKLAVFAYIGVVMSVGFDMFLETELPLMVCFGMAVCILMLLKRVLSA